MDELKHVHYIRKNIGTMGMGMDKIRGNSDPGIHWVLGFRGFHGLAINE